MKVIESGNTKCKTVFLTVGEKCVVQRSCIEGIKIQRAVLISSNISHVYSREHHLDAFSRVWRNQQTFLYLETITHPMRPRTTLYFQGVKYNSLRNRTLPELNNHDGRIITRYRKLYLISQIAHIFVLWMFKYILSAL